MGYKIGDKVSVDISVDMIIRDITEYGDYWLELNNSDDAGIDGLYCVDAGQIRKADENPTKTYEDGLADAWKIARRIVLNEEKCKSSFSYSDLMQIFGTSSSFNVLAEFTISEVNKKIAEWKDRKDIHVGDVVEVGDGKFMTGVVTNEVILDRGSLYVMWKDGSCGEQDKNKLIKTGQHIDIEKILDEIEVRSD